jgi:hypothetical protein
MDEIPGVLLDLKYARSERINVVKFPGMVRNVYFATKLGRKYVADVEASALDGPST